MTQQDRAIVLSEQQMRTAVSQRDGRLDGVFFYGVITTGVFCLPSCGARPARPENLRFFTDASDAQTSGLRPCKRCRPLDAAYEFDAAIEIAQKLQEGDTRAVAQLAAAAHMSPARLQKKFKNIFGVTIKAYRDGVKRGQFKAALHQTDTVTDAIYAAGYSSTSRVYNTQAANIGMSPSAYRAGGKGENIFYVSRTTTMGWLSIAATGVGICFVQFADDEQSLIDQLRQEFPEANIRQSSKADSPELDQWIESLENHLTHDAPRPDLPLDLRGTAFQIKVWKFLLSVPDGDVVSYSDVSRGIAKPAAVRAAASACGANRIAVLIPCHRVLRGDGGIGGYRWGVERKRGLLDAERARKFNQQL